MVKLHWLLPSSVATVVLVSSPAVAARFDSWRFDANQKRLEINTSGAVQPKAELIFNPTRLVIDLPGTTFGRPPESRQFSGNIREVRVAQFDQQTTRLVVEISSGYTLDPKKIKFEPMSGNRWTVQLPEPHPKPSSSNDSSTSDYAVISESKTGSPPELSNAVANVSASTTIERLHVTGDGFFLRTKGANPEVKITRSRDRATIFMDIVDASLSPDLKVNDIINRHGVSNVEFTLLNGQPPVVRISLRVNKDSPDWWISSRSSGGLVVLPTRTVISRNINNNNPDVAPRNPSPDVSQPQQPITKNSTAMIEAVELVNNGTQLLIKSDQTVNATSAWDHSSGLFRITIPNAKLGNNVRGPNLDANSPVLRVRLQPQVDSVVVLVQPAAGVQIRQVNPGANTVVTLDLQNSHNVASVVVVPPLPSPDGGQIPTPNPPRETVTSPPQSRTPRGKVVVMIDPGHGGKDPGAIGIGGLREKDVVLSVSQRITKVLQENGVEAILTRNSDYFVSLQGRVDLAARADADLFVSIHANSISMSRPEVNGLETYYHVNGEALAESIHRSVLQSVNVRDRRVRQARFYVLRKSSMPSVLVELGFVTGAEDASKLSSPAYQNQMANAIARGILQYIQRR